MSSELRRYKYVSYKAGSRGKPGWVAQILQDGKQVTVGGVHATQKKAAQAAATQLKVSLASLTLRAPKPPRRGAAGPAEPSAVAGPSVAAVVQSVAAQPAAAQPAAAQPAAAQPAAAQPAVQSHSSSSSQTPRKEVSKKYVYKRGDSYVVCMGNSYHGSFSTPAAAAQVVAELLGEPAGKSLQDRPVKPQELKERLAAGLQVYHDYEPPDLENLSLEVQLSSSLWAAEPTLAFLSALGKYGPWRANLRQEATAVLGGQASKEESMDTRVDRLLSVILRTVQAMESAAWHPAMLRLM